MSRTKKIRNIVVILLLLAVMYCYVAPFYIHRVSMKLAEDISILTQTGDIKEFDRYFESDTVIIIKKEARTYAECRNNIMNYQKKSEQLSSDSYGAYDMEWLESPFTLKKMSIHMGGAGEPGVWFHMKFGLFPKIDKIHFEADFNGNLEVLFFGDKIV